MSLSVVQNKNRTLEAYDDFKGNDFTKNDKISLISLPIISSSKIEEPVVLNQVEMARKAASILFKYANIYSVTDPSGVVFFAASVGDLDGVKTLLEYGVSPNAKGSSLNVLDYACRSRNINLIKYLVDERDITPGHYDPFLEFIACGCAPFFEGIDLFLSRGYEFSDDALFNLFRHNVPTVETINAMRSRGLDTSVVKNPKYSEMCSQILKLILRGPSFIANGQPSDVALGLSSNLELFNLMLSLDLSVNTQIGFVKSDLRNKRLSSEAIYNTPLLVTIANNDTFLAKKLIEHGADVNMTGLGAKYHGQSGVTGMYGLYGAPYRVSPLQLAMEYGHEDLIALLLENGAKF